MTRFTALLLPLLICSATAQAAELTASVDRSRLNSGETVELTLETSDVTQFGKPDLTPLEPLFEVRGTRQVNQLNTLNGDNRATTRWIITLLPKENGSVVIPPLQMGDVQSQPITVQVVESDTREDKNSLDPVFIEVSLDQPSVYVQAQAILTLRIYHSVSLYDDSSLTPLQIADARVEQLGDTRTYEKDINGVRHGVIEMRYAIYPQHSGLLSIAPQTFSATLVDTQPAQDASAQGPKAGKLMRVSSAQIPLTVKPKPLTYPRCAVAAGAQPEPERELEPGAGAHSGRRLPDAQPDTQSRRPRQFTTARATGHRGQRPAPLPGSTGTQQSEQRTRPDRQP